MKLKESLPLKIALMGILALLMLVPLGMVQSQIHERERTASQSRDEVAASWGRAQTLTGPVLRFGYDVEVQDAQQNTTVKRETAKVYPRALAYDLNLSTQTLHRSIYDILVYGADVVLTGDFIIPALYAEKDLKSQSVAMWLSDLRGIEGPVDMTLGDQSLSFQAAAFALRVALVLPSV